MGDAAKVHSSEAAQTKSCAGRTGQA